MTTLLKQKFRNWAFRRTVESGTVVLNQRRIYILPTRQGLGFSLFLLLMLLGDINYNLSLGYALTFILATSGVISMLHAFRNLAQLEIHAGHVAPVFAGEQACFVFHFHNSSTLTRRQIMLRDDAGHKTVFDLDALRSSPVQLVIPGTRRGWMDSGRLTLHTEYPLGLFRAWSYLHFDVPCLVYPKPEARRTLPASTPQQGNGNRPLAEDEDFAGLRAYAPSDALTRIAWKTFARGQGLHVKQYAGQEGHELWLEWSQLTMLTTEGKLERLARWVLDAETQQLRYGLRLPGREISPQSGPAHCAECLRALALFGSGGK